MSESYHVPGPMSEAESQALDDLLVRDENLALGYFEALIGSGYGNGGFNEFLKREAVPGDSSSCQHVISEKKIMFHCKTCAMNSDAAVCLDCFLKGDHKGHKCAILKGDGRKCACGDSPFWKESGCCPEHRNKADGKPVVELEPEKKTFLSSIIVKVLNSVLAKPKLLKVVGKWLTKFIGLGDRYLRLVVSVFTEGDFLVNFLQLFYRERICLPDVCVLLERLLTSREFDEVLRRTVINLYPWLLEQAASTTAAGDDGSDFLHLNKLLVNLINTRDFKAKYSQKDWLDIFAAHVKYLIDLTKSQSVTSPIESSYREIASVFLLIMKDATQEEMQKMFDLLIEAFKPVEGQGVEMTDMKKKSGMVLVYAFLAQYLEINRFDLDWSKLRITFSNMEPGLPFQKCRIVPCCLYLHVMAGYATKKGLNIQTITDNLDDLLVYPMRFLVALYFHQMNILPATRHGLVEMVKLYIRMGLHEAVTPYLEMLMHSVFKLAKDRELLIHRIASIFGVFTKTFGHQYWRGVSFGFLFTLVCLMTDDPYIYSRDDILEHKIESILAEKPRGLVKVLVKMNLKESGLDEDHVRELVHNVATTERRKNGEVFQLHPNANPFHLHFHILEAGGMFMEKVIPLPPILESFTNTIVSSTFLAVCYHLLALNKKDSSFVNIASLRVILQLLPEVLNHQESKEEVPIGVFIDSLECLVDAARKLNVQTFAAKPFVLTFCETPKATLLSLIGASGPLGQKVLEALGRKESRANRQADRAKAKAQSNKEKILQAMAARQSAFADKFHDELEVKERAYTCAICGEEKDEELCYQVQIYNHFFLTKRPVHMVMCMHSVHRSCVKAGEENNSWQCPLDRAPRNDTIPIFSKGYEKDVTEQTKKAIMDFIDVLKCYDRPTKNEGTPVTYAFLNACKVVDNRLLDSTDLDVNAEKLLHLLFLVLWHLRRMGKEIFDDQPQKPNEKLLDLCVNCEEPEKQFRSFVSTIASELKGIHLYKFLRYCAILEAYCIKPGDDVDDWLEELDFARLIERFGISAQPEPVKLTGFGMVELPERMIDLALPPFNVKNIDDQSEKKWLCLMTGRVYECGKERLARQLIEKEQAPVKLLLALTGEAAGATFIFRAQPPSLTTVPSVYCDEYGQEDIRYQRGQLLCLNRKRYAACRDLLISGMWMNEEKAGH